MERQFDVRTDRTTEVVDVTDRVSSALPGSVETGTCTVFVPHTTAAVVVNEAEGRLVEDIEAAVERLVPDSAGYRHDEVDDNAAAHLRASLLGESVTVPVEGGELALGSWQSVLFVECDGPRSRRLHVSVVGS